MRGGEKVLEELCRLYPTADIFTLVLDRDSLSPFLATRNITTSFLQRIPGIRKHYQKVLPLMPFALEHLDLSAYDLIISSESGPAKGVITRPDAVHVCYCHSPMRYVWDHYHVYRRDLPRTARMMLALFAPPLRAWDASTAARVDAFIANSHHVARRIKRYYNRDAVVIPPPVSVDDFAIQEGPKDFYLCAGQLVTYKRIDLAVRAFTQTGRNLVIIGEGPQYDRLRQIAGPTIKFLGRQPFDSMREHMARCRALIFPGEEDFGIVPLEVMASGRPVIAFDAGGAKETVPLWGGFRFPEQTVESLLAAVERYEAVEADIDSAALRRHAQGFAPDIFRARIAEFVDGCITNAGAREQPTVLEGEVVPFRPRLASDDVLVSLPVKHRASEGMSS
ncbi:glycosyltransferase [Aureimonas psammosilenae]|uniref:glycosyltransferase n=1 Tax=Aureimonas psammosilenae TaxID=2495496 RepID=UPI0012613A6D|nr:glycosyltransferase [Aureimonas psammosilenae]